MRTICWRSIALFTLGMVLGLAGWDLSHRTDEAGRGFLIRAGYPPLVYAPATPGAPYVSAASAVLLEATTGTILYAKNEHVRRAPASTTKIVTALIALERGDLRSLVTVGPRAGWTPGSSVGLRPGDRLSLGELLQGLMLSSGNDAGVAIAEHVARSEEEFVRLMNLRAREFGAFNTNFRNPHGLPALGHYTTAFDLALITRYALRHPTFARLVRTREEELQWAVGERRLPLTNTNRLLWSFAGADGVKTGTTSEAGHCLVASATRDGRQLIAVVLRSADRWHDAATLLAYGFEAFRLLRLAKEGREIARLRVAGGRSPTVALVPRTDLAVVCPKGQEHLLRLHLSLAREPIPAPVLPHRVLGRLTVTYDGEEVEGVDLLPREAVRKRSWWPPFAWGDPEKKAKRSTAGGLVVEKG
ncbi:MAG: D-alanyl-D-alanine carboxypeptidase [Firmicutes bacterium]|nr:D-alanyl-D-alanine carboxypeptidase [Bacillota bacterium]